MNEVISSEPTQEKFSRKQRKALEKKKNYEDDLLHSIEAANSVNGLEDLPFSVSVEKAQIAEGSRNIVFNKMSVTINGKILFKDAAVKFSSGSRYGLMGPNGRGKTTLLKLMAARELPIQSNLDLLLVEQEQEFNGSDLSAVTAVLQSHRKCIEFTEEVNILQEKKELTDEELERLNFLENELELMGASEADSKARRILFGLGFPTEWHDRPTKSFSGGWRKRIALAAAVFIEPDVLMLDEPTNHLDLNAVIWLEEYLSRVYNENTKRPKILITVSHDTNFLDEVCTYMVHIDCYKLNYYRGGFGKFHEQVEQHNKELDKKYITLKRKIDQKKNKGMTKEQVNEWIKSEIEHGFISEEHLTKRVTYMVKFPVEVPPKLRNSTIISLDNVSFHYPNSPNLFENVSLGLWTNSRITVCGPNGIGKSTLLNLMTGVLEPTEGNVTINREVRIGRYNQHFVDKLPLERTATEYIQSLGITAEDQARRLLGKFGLEGIVHKNQLATLSGGQKARVAFAAISAEKPHFLLLDEPTNHLDIEAITALCDAIRSFEGGVLVVTHDARLIEETEMEIWVVGDLNIKPFNGDLEDYKDYVRKLFQNEEIAKEKQRRIVKENRKEIPNPVKIMADNNKQENGITKSNEKDNSNLLAFLKTLK